MKPGDGVYFGGKGPVSRGIALRTCSLGQLWNGELISHVGTVYERNGQLEIAESTTLDSTPCCVTGQHVRGVQAHPLGERIDEYDGRVWRSPLNQWQAIDSALLTLMVLAQIGKPYDEVGCLICGTELLKSFWHFTPNAAFCSELRLWLLIQLNKLVTCPGRPGRISPAALARLEEASQLFNPLERVK